MKGAKIAFLSISALCVFAGATIFFMSPLMSSTVPANIAQVPLPDVHAETAGLNEKGLELKRSGRIDEAVSMYRSAVAADPLNADAMNNLAVALEDLNEPALAEKEYLRAIDADPTSMAAHLNYAIMLDGQHRGGEALAHYYAFAALSQDPALKSLVDRRIEALSR